jgi:Galactose oxidase, central domain
MAGSIFLADLTDTSTSSRCGNGPAPTGRGYFLQRSPFARSSAAVATNPTIDQVVLFGGLADVNPNNTWTYDGTTWTLRSPVIQPLLVYAASAAFDPNINFVIIFGGGSGGVDQNTTWLWFAEGGNWNWQQVATTQSPPPREGAGMAYLPALGRVIVLWGTRQRDAAERHLGIYTVRPAA